MLSFFSNLFRSRGPFVTATLLVLTLSLGFFPQPLELFRSLDASADVNCRGKVFRLALVWRLQCSIRLRVQVESSNRALE
ncbi:hypothetical protein V8C37DRAFT_374057 [Trichoderma ceciliae]